MVNTFAVMRNEALHPGGIPVFDRRLFDELIVCLVAMRLGIWRELGFSREYMSELLSWISTL